MNDDSLDFEYWVRWILPKKLCLSKNKKAAVNSVLYHFADFIRPLERKAPKEFHTFFEALKDSVERASKMRKPFGYYIHGGRYKELPKEELELLKKDKKCRRR